jgi:ubiquinone/menaquinone biosynthesis C-methylase UbiE
MVTALLAQLVGAGGQVVGIDSSGPQLAQAHRRLHPGGAHIRLVEASATDTGSSPGRSIWSIAASC